MQLGLNRPPVPFQDGSASWNASAADALAIWNQYIDTVKFVEAPPVSPSGDDGANSVFFSNTIYGQTFGSTTLAVTIGYNSGGGIFTEADVIFNDARTWNSYRGPIQGSGATATYDFHRVALHEFGHVLGLDHPDQHGQSVIALMNSIISNLDHLADDDIAGGRFLYGLKLSSSLNPPSARSGDNFAYQITANNNPSKYSAAGLPPGLALDAGTGLISGRCTTSGTFLVDVTVEGALGTATGRIQIVIVPLPILSSSYIQVQIGDSLSYQIAAGNSPTSFDATGLPAGLQFDSSKGLISGVAQVAGNFTVRLIARSASSEAAGNLSLVVMPPRITSFYPSPVELGDPFSYQITATNNPTSFGATGLPPGLQLNPSTGLISGTSTIAGYFNVTVTAQTTFGNATSIIPINILAPRITSPPYLSPTDVGSNFSYQITGSNHPSSFTAIGLPAGLYLDPATGRISGVVELSGQYQVLITATGATGTASTTLAINVQALETADPPLKKIPVTAYGTIVADPVRSRLYVQVPNGVSVIDTNSLAVIQTVPLQISFQSDLSISADGNKLWVTAYYDSRIRSIDLNTLAPSTTLTTTRLPRLVREGGDGSLYITDYNQSDVFQIDANTGATLSQFRPASTFGACWIEMSPDRKTIYVEALTSKAPLAKFSVGSPTTLLQQVEVTPSTQSSGRRLAVNPNGGSISIITQNYSSFAAVDPTIIRSVNDLTFAQGTFSSPNAPTQLVYSPDGSLAFQSMQQRSRIDVFQTGNQNLLRTITLPDRAVPATDSFTTTSMAVDRTNSYLFVASSNQSAAGALYVYSLVPPPATPTPPKSLLNVSTRLRAQAGDNALIGGFIITGQEAKKIVLRAIGPSLSVPGKLGDPILELHDGTGALVAQNDNWNAHRADVLATGIPPSDEHESVIVARLLPGSYTVVVRGVNQSSGVALVEAYDLSSNSNSKLANISTRGRVETGDNVMIGGFIIGGDQPTNVVVRAIGPSLARSNVADALADPTLEVYDGNGALHAQDDDWRMYQEQLLIDSGLAPTDDHESAMFLGLDPGNYTAIVRGKGNSTGVGLVEVYNLDSN